MKKFLLLIITLSAVFFTSCDANSLKAITLECENELSGEIKTGDVKAMCNLSLSEDECVISFTSPESLDGLTLTASEKETKAVLEGIEFCADNDRLSISTVCEKILGAFRKAKADGELGRDSGTAMRISGATKDGGFAIVYDENGIVSINSGEYTFTRNNG